MCMAKDEMWTKIDCLIEAMDRLTEATLRERIVPPLNQDNSLPFEPDTPCL